MARQVTLEPSRTLAEFRLLPGLTNREHAFDKVSLDTVLTERPGKEHLRLNIPLVSSAMQSVSGDEMGVALAREGGVAFVFCSQAIPDQVAMVTKVKSTPAGDGPLEAHDEGGNLLCVGAINTHDHVERVPVLVEAGADAVAIDSSDGHTDYQEEAIRWIRDRYPELSIIGGNVITAAGFDFLVRAGANAVKVGMGGGSICITQEQKGTGRGQATAILDVCAARDRFRQATGRFIPIIADGGILTSKDMVIALALGADAVMLGRWFAQMDESPTDKALVDGKWMKPYWGEGSARAQAWRAQRYHQGLFFEGVEGYVEALGGVADNLVETLAKIKSSMSSCGAASVRELHAVAQLELVSPLSIREGQVHDIHMPPYKQDQPAAQRQDGKKS